MLNLNYNINKALGGMGCIGVMKYNYSASIWVIGAGGGGATDPLSRAGGGGGGGMVVSQSISIIPNLIYTINVGISGFVDGDGQDSSLIGWDDNDIYPISFFAQGGRKGLSDGTGGNSGTGSIVRDGVVTSYPGFTGGTAYVASNSFGPQKGGGGGASNAANGNNATNGFGGNGASGYTAGGGGGALFVGPTGPYGQAGGQGGGEQGGYGSGGDGYSNQQNQQTNPRNATAGNNGAVIIQYSGKPKAFVTNANTIYSGGSTTHTFNTGVGTFVYTFPYPYEESVTPYQVVLCPPLYR